MPDTSPQTDRKPLPLHRKIQFTLVILFFFSLVLAAVGEVYFRNCCMEFYEKPKPIPPYDTAQRDALLGWKMTPGYTFDGIMRSEDGTEYPLSLRYDENGFKTFGDTTNGKPRILFIGDSFTASIEVSNGMSFFDILGDSLDAEVFAYGHAGFGTLQEFFVFDQWVDRLRPGIVVWEVCSNDFIDNHASLEIACGYKVGERRPYLSEQGKIFYRRPLSLWQRACEVSVFCKWLDERLLVLTEKITGEPHRVGEYYIATQKRDYPRFDRSVRTTEQIIASVRERLPEGTALIGFSADTYQPQLDEFRRIFEETGFAFYDAPARAIDKARIEQKLVVRSVDACHWNELGHEIVAGALLPVLNHALLSQPAM